jgi:hypothetical protein
MALDQERIYAALHERLKEKLEGNGFVAVTRERVDASRLKVQPVLQVVEIGGVSTPVRNLPAVWTLQADAVIYARPEKISPAPGAEISQLVRLVEAALERDPEESPGASGETRWTTLGGLVQHAWIAGSVERAFVKDAEQAIVFVPIEMVTSTAARG